MKRIVLTVLAALFAIVALSRLAIAQVPQEKYPLFSKERVSLATGAQYAWRTTPLANNSEPLQGRHSEWEAGVFGAYNLTPHASLVGSTTIGIDSKQFRHTLGLRIRIWRGDR